MSALPALKHVPGSGLSAGDEWISVPLEGWRETATELREAGYRSWVFLTCGDHLASPVTQPAPERFELVLELRNMEAGRLLRVRTFVPEARPVAPSLHDIFAPANWDERETFDLFGITFEGHPDLRRILMPASWEGHPLRKDYPIGGEPVRFSEAE